METTTRCVCCAAALVLLGGPASGQPERGPKPPQISQFVLYAEQSIRLGERCRADDGDVGVRTAMAPRRGVAQLTVGRNDHCRNLFAPSTKIENDAEVRDVWTDALARDPDSEMKGQGSFPASVMPPLPLAAASGTGPDVIVRDEKERSLEPGHYGAVRLGHECTLKLAAGRYTFASVRMGERSRILGERGARDQRAAEVVGVDVHILGELWMGEHAQIGPEWGGATARDFTIEVGGSDPEEVTRGTRLTPTTVVSLGPEARVHALLAAPHGTVWMADEAGVRGAVAAFAIVAEERLRAQFESGFPVAPPDAQGSQRLHGYFGVNPDPSVAPLVGPVAANTEIALAIGLPVRDPAGLQSLVKQVSDPKSANFRKFLTQAQFDSTYGATPSDYQAVEDWAKNTAGFTIVRTYPNNLLVSVRATAAQIENALFVNLVYRLRKDGSRFVAVDREPSLDLSVPVLQISGLTDFPVMRPAVTLNGTGGGKSYRAADLRDAYLGTGSLCQKLDGTGEVVGIVDFATFNQNDINSYDAEQLPPINPGNVSIVATEGGNPAPNSALEATLDVELVQAMAPNAKILFFQGSTGITGHLDDILHAMATSSPPLTVASCSLSFGRSDNSQQALDEMAAQGVTFLTASGDFGDVGDPQDNEDMGNQTLVGGSVLSTNPLVSGLPSPVYPAGYYLGEGTWNLGQPPQSQDVTSGGIMDGNNKNGNCYCWPHDFCCGSGVSIPDYQVGVSMATNGGSTTWRNYPDVSMAAANTEIFFQGKNTGGVIGTSLAAPLWAGFMALVDQKSQQIGGGPMGFINPTVYDIGLTSGLATDLYKACFHDIADSGNNADGFGPGFTTVAGYDLTTGWGTPSCQLLNQLAIPTPLTPNLPLDLIRFVIKTGGDNLGGGLHGSSATADVLLQDGSSFTVTLRNSSEATWDNWSTHQLDFPVPAGLDPPLTQFKGIAGVRIDLVQSNPDWSADNWDIANLGVSLFNPGSPQVCQLNLDGTASLQDGSTGLVRLSKSCCSSGVGPSQTFLVSSGSGCP
jgi:hypothetical protein